MAPVVNLRICHLLPQYSAIIKLKTSFDLEDTHNPDAITVSYFYILISAISLQNFNFTFISP
ncbi:hypothetical protein Hanom_Chr10g00952961 [Helianthus anomalus]